jgi:hypothetical protein
MKVYFDHERLEVYQAGRRFNREVARLLEEIPRGHVDSKDQLKRAAKSEDPRFGSRDAYRADPIPRGSHRHRHVRIGGVVSPA